MVSIWMIGGGVLAAAAAALAALRYRSRHRSRDASSSVHPVSEEWLSQARATKEHEW